MQQVEQDWRPAAVCLVPELKVQSPHWGTALELAERSAVWVQLEQGRACWQAERTRLSPVLEP